MKKLFLVLAALLAIVLPKTVQAIDAEGIYVGGLAGINFLNSDKSSHHHHRRGREDFKAGWIGGGYVGYRMCEGFRGEFEASFRSNKHKHAHRPVQTWSFMFNGYYEVPMCWCIVPYVGAGIGWDNVKHRTCRSDIETESRHRRDHRDDFAWQLMAGGFYPIDDCMTVGLEYIFHKNQAFKHFFNNTVAVRIDFFL